MSGLDRLLAEKFNRMLAKCTADEDDFRDGGVAPLTKRLAQFVTEGLDHPAEADLVLRSVLQDLGARVFRQLLIAGQSRRDENTNLEQNQADLSVAVYLLQAMAVECSHTPLLPRGVADLLHRITNALDDIARSGVNPALFDLPEKDGNRRPLDTAGVRCEGWLAAALEIAVAGGMKLSEAERWLDAVISQRGLVDAAGNRISAKRVVQWRSNFRKGVGAHHARRTFADAKKAHTALIAAPTGASKLRACRDLASEMVRLAVTISNRTVAPPRDD
jgi:hypothetical protein